MNEEKTLNSPETGETGIDDTKTYIVKGIVKSNGDKIETKINAATVGDAYKNVRDHIVRDYIGVEIISITKE
jgi:hypothetical protein